MEFKISYVEFYNKIGRHFGLWLKETKEKEEMTFPEFIKSIGLRGISKRNIDGVRHIVYRIIDPEKWFLAKIKYGI